MKKTIYKSLFYIAAMLLCMQYAHAGASYGSLYDAFSRAQRGALYQAKAVTDLDNPACPEIVKCLCRLVLDVDTAFRAGKTPDYNGIITNAKSICSTDTLNSLKQYVELKSGESNEAFLKKLYNKSLIIKDVTVPDSVKKAGAFNTTNIKDFLNRAIKENKLFDTGLANISLTDIKSAGGAGTLELFIAKNNETQKEWVLKGIPDPKREAFALSIIAQTTALAPIIQPNSKPNFPVLSLPIAYLGYNINDKKGVLSVMTKAAGKEFFAVMKEYNSARNDANKKNLIEAYKLLGTTLGNFDREYPQRKSTSPFLTPTYVHGDFHVRNIFVDVPNKKIYWIDNENMGRTIFQPTSPARDLEEALFIFTSNYIIDRSVPNGTLSNKLFGAVPTEQQKRDWVRTFYPAFFNGYLDAFGSNKQQAAQEMKDMLINHKGSNNFYDDAVMQEIIKILDGIIQGK